MSFGAVPGTGGGLFGSPSNTGGLSFGAANSAGETPCWKEPMYGEKLRYGEPDWENDSENVVRPGEKKSYEEIRLEEHSAPAGGAKSQKPMGINPFFGPQSTFSSLRDKTEMVTILVGPGIEAKWVIHKHLLVTNSKIVAAMMNHGFKEQLEGVIRFPEEDPDIFDLYIKFLYCGSITTPDLSEQIQMYTIALRMQDPKFQHSCFHAIASSWNSYTAQNIKYILEETMEDDRLRQCCIDQVGRGILTGRYKFEAQADKDLLGDHMPEIMDGVVRAVSKSNQSGFIRSPFEGFSSHESASTSRTNQASAGHYTPNLGWRPILPRDEIQNTVPGSRLFAGDTRDSFIPSASRSLFDNRTIAAGQTTGQAMGTTLSDVFHGTNQPRSSGLFGQPTFAAASNQPSSNRPGLFATTFSANDTFGANGTFGTNDTFGANNTFGNSLFGTRRHDSASLFGGSHNTGSNAIDGTGGGLFGSNTVGGGLFGSRPVSGGLFGNAQTSNARNHVQGIGLFNNNRSVPSSGFGSPTEDSPSLATPHSLSTGSSSSCPHFDADPADSSVNMLPGLLDTPEQQKTTQQAPGSNGTAPSAANPLPSFEPRDPFEEYYPQARGTADKQKHLPQRSSNLRAQLPAPRLPPLEGDGCAQTNEESSGSVTGPNGKGKEKELPNEIQSSEPPRNANPFSTFSFRKS